MNLEQILNYYNDHASAARQGIAVNWEMVAINMAHGLKQAITENRQEPPPQLQ